MPVSKKFGLHELVKIVWFVVDSFTHLTIEAGYVYLALTTTAEKSDSYMGQIWREYARADARWAIRDPNVISIEIITVVLGFACIWQVYALWYRLPERYVLGLVISVCELYGGWMTFCPEWVSGSPSLVTNDWILLWIYLVFMNGLWVVIPLLISWEAWATIYTCISKTTLINTYEGPTKVWWVAAAGTIVLYLILVPLVLSMSEGVPVLSDSARRSEL